MSEASSPEGKLGRPEPLPQAPEPTQLEESIAAADMMIGYAARYGVNVPTDAIQIITKAKESCKKGLLKAEQEAKFYGAFNEISKAIAPVTPASLEACLDESAVAYKRWPWSTATLMSHAKVAVRRYHRRAFIALIALLITQVYWAIGATLISSIPELNQKEQTSQENSRTAPKPSPPANPDALSAGTDENAETEENESGSSKGGKEEAREATVLWLLSLWSAPWRWSEPLLAKAIPSEDVISLKAKKTAGWGLGISAQFVLNILQTYLLPLLYGWVGAMAYVMRSLITSVQNRTFRREHEVEYNLRTYLGLLSGLAIGWFIGSSVSQEGVTSLAPAAVSFLAGYSVEILFSIMDRLVAAFGSAAAPSPAPTPTQAPTLATAPVSRGTNP